MMRGVLHDNFRKTGEQINILFVNNLQNTIYNFLYISLLTSYIIVSPMQLE